MAEDSQTETVGQENQHGIKVFGGATATAEPNPNPNPDSAKPEKQEGKAEVLDDKSSEAKKKEASLNADGKEDKTEPTKTAPKAETQKPEKKEQPENKEEPKSEKLKITFGDNDEEQPKATTDNKQETVSVTKEVVLDYLKNNGFDDLKEISDLSKTETLPDEVAKFKQYHEETGRGISDFYNLQKDWKSESKESVIKEFLKLKHPDLDEDQINTQFDVLNVTDEDEEQLTPRELNRVKAEFDSTYSQAISFLGQKTKEFQVPLENVQKQAPQPSKADIAKAYEPYWEGRDKALEGLNEVKFDIDGLGEIKIEIDEHDKTAISQRTQTEEAMIESWKNDDKSINHSKLVTDNAWAIPSVRQKMLKSIIEQTHTLALLKFSKENRNVDLDDLNKSESGKNKKNNGALVKFGESKKGESQTFGTPIVR